MYFSFYVLRNITESQWNLHPGSSWLNSGAFIMFFEWIIKENVLRRLVLEFAVGHSFSRIFPNQEFPQFAVFVIRYASNLLSQFQLQPGIGESKWLQAKISKIRVLWKHVSRDHLAQKSHPTCVICRRRRIGSWDLKSERTGLNVPDQPAAGATKKSVIWV